MKTDELKIKLIDNIISYFRYQLISEIEENKEKIPIFNKILELMILMNKDKYIYTLVDIDNALFDSLILEISNLLYITN